MTQMDMNGTVNQRDSINYNWPLLAVTQGLTRIAYYFRSFLQWGGHTSICARTQMSSHQCQKWV